MPIEKGEKVVFETRVSKPLRAYPQEDLSITGTDCESTVWRSSPELKRGLIRASERILELEGDGEIVRVQRVIERKAPFRATRLGQYISLLTTPKSS